MEICLRPSLLTNLLPIGKQRFGEGLSPMVAYLTE
jgi:hypothetical protein